MTWLTELFGGKKPKSADLARERLTVVIARQRSDDSKPSPDFLPALQKELIDVISKYVRVNPEDISVQLEKQDNYEALKVNIVLPEHAR
ncbi:cell division topological specificity factor MinE [Niveibacterium sp. SC-1]|uniref:cell division topological specificity factor MinE n=1 Tax=Niveibacterium sp. SC-1 TaxID=3135646 RepID=UPI00311F33F8